LDNSETYVKMCEKAEEIQKYWIPVPNDYAIDCITITNMRNLVTVQNDAEYPFLDVQLSTERQNEFRRRCIWLPRQDQLQELLQQYWWADKQPLNNISLLLQKFYWWLDETCPNNQSMEQLWLSFVMSKCYQKIWNGSEWLKR